MYPNRLILLQNQNPKNLEKMKPKEVLEKWIDCFNKADAYHICLLYTSPSPRDGLLSRMPSSA